jgi:hopanoid biosynthesis associated protein HpnK
LKRLIITADDFGASVEVNEAVEEAHRRGVLTAASLMAGGSAVSDAVRRAERNPTLKVGLHLALSEGEPVLPASELPDLVTRAGDLRSDLAALGADIFFRPSARRQAAAEIEAQFEAFRRTGLALDHVNAHQHFHLHPTIGDLMLKIGGRYGLVASRAPVEPRAVLRAVEPGPMPSAFLADLWARRLRARFRQSGVFVADQVFGLAWSGAMTAARLCGVIRRLPQGLTEIYLHPATSGDFKWAAPGYRYAEELGALLAPETREAVLEIGAQLGAFSHFIPSSGPFAAAAARR